MSVLYFENGEGQLLRHFITLGRFLQQQVDHSPSLLMDHSTSGPFDKR